MLLDHVRIGRTPVVILGIDVKADVVTVEDVVEEGGAAGGVAVDIVVVDIGAAAVTQVEAAAVMVLGRLLLVMSLPVTAPLQP
ncbi:MAG: hypothetical protein IPM84_20765 [Anaerolineae bacterium]|nr:hypothetical protein [Anaerolineae bacterium]